MNRADVAAQLKSVPMFRECSSRQRRSIASRGWERRFPEGAVLCEQGKRGEDFFVILDGEAEVVRDGRRIRNLAAGEHFGELALLYPSVAGIPRTATVTAVTPLRCFVLNKLDFRLLIYDGELAVLVFAFDAGGPAQTGLAAVVQLVPAAVLAPLLGQLGDRYPPPQGPGSRGIPPRGC